MRCWDCDALIVVPEIIDGETGVAGQIRAGVRDRETKRSQTVTQNMACPRCGARYIQTTSRLPGRVEVANKDQRRRKDDR